MGTILDRLIEYISPSWAIERAVKREALRSFDALSPTLQRLRARAPQTLGPWQETQIGREKLTTTARDLDMNNAWAHGLFNSVVDNIVGEGIVPEVQLKGPRGALKVALNDRLEKEWSTWAEGCDLSGETSFYELEAQVERELWVAGEVLVAETTREVAQGDRRLPFALELIESERLSDKTEDLAGGGRILQGVEFDRTWKRVAYWIYENHPAEGGTANQPKRVPADRILHIFHPHRISAVRGLSRIHSVANTFGALAQYLDYELTRARIVASWALMLKRNSRTPLHGPTVEGTSSTDDQGNPLLHVHGGMVFQGGPQDSLESAGPAVQTTAFEPFVNLMLRMVAAGLNVSFEVLTRDFSRTNFSSSRSSSLEDRRHWKPRQQFLKNRLCNPVYRKFLRYLSIRDGSLSGIDLDAVPVFWRAPGWDWVDPTKEISADEIAVKNGFKSPQEVCAEHGRDFYAIVDQRAEAEAYASERKVVLSFTVPEGAGTTGAQEESNGDENEEDGGSGSKGGRGDLPKARGAQLLRANSL